ncbi:hypothetical protein [Vulcanisaeta sp. JCM 16161]|uniref:hypothetical protein n=2 Tax=Vulcanisaeta sp. JCM 16161 TaxID=1295372 RepID=UPI001FB42A67|nr:hypothetical protein [Vulcanisaeta sp. JCM 16161]
MLMGREDRVSYKRGSTIIRIITTRERLQLKDYIKAYVLIMSNDGIVLREYNQDGDFNGMRAYIIYSKA